MEPPLLGDASRPTGGCSCAQLVLTSYPRPVPQRAHWYLPPSPLPPTCNLYLGQRRYQTLGDCETRENCRQTLPLFQMWKLISMAWLPTRGSGRYLGSQLVVPQQVLPQLVLPQLVIP